MLLSKTGLLMFINYDVFSKHLQSVKLPPDTQVVPCEGVSSKNLVKSKTCSKLVGRSRIDKFLTSLSNLH